MVDDHFSDRLIYNATGGYWIWRQRSPWERNGSFDGKTTPLCLPLLQKNLLNRIDFVSFCERHEIETALIQYTDEYS